MTNVREVKCTECHGLDPTGERCWRCYGNGTITTWKCPCGAACEWQSPGEDVECDRCHRLFNSSGQELRSDAPRFSVLE